MKEVGHPKKGQEEDMGPHRHHPHPEGERPEGVKCHWVLPHKEGGDVDDTHAPAVHDGAQGVVQR